MPNYWLGIMALAFAAALAVWIVVVFRADRNPSRRAQDSTPHREVIGGAFEAREGGRQLMPDPGTPLSQENKDENGLGTHRAPGPGPGPAGGRPADQDPGGHA